MPVMGRTSYPAHLKPYSDSGCGGIQLIHISGLSNLTCIISMHNHNNYPVRMHKGVK